MMKHSSTLDGPALFRVSSRRSKNPGQIWGGMYQRMLKQLNFQTTRMRWVEITLWSLWSLYSGTLDAKDMKLQSNKGIDSDCQVTYGTVDFASYKSQPEDASILFYVTSAKLRNEANCMLRVANTERRQKNPRGTPLQNMQMYSCHLLWQICGPWSCVIPVVRSILQHRTTWHMSHMSHINTTKQSYLNLNIRTSSMQQH